MTTRWQRILRLVQLGRIELIFSVISNTWLMILLARKIETSRGVGPAMTVGSLALALGLGAAVATGLAIYGLALNDAFDARHDRAFSPERPIPAGAISLTTVIVLGVLGLLGAVLATAFLGLGSTVLCVIAAIAILFYNITGKFFPAVGIMLLGLIRALNMFIPYPWVEFAWPIWLTMTHVMICAVVVHVLEGKRPRLHGPDWWGLCAGWTFWTLTLVTWMSWRNQGAPGLVQGRPGLWLGPLIAAGLFALVSWYNLRAKMRPLRARRAAAGAFLRLSMLWLILYDAVWLLSAGFYGPGCLLLLLFTVAWSLVQFVAALTHLAAPPVTYQIKPASVR